MKSRTSIRFLAVICASGLLVCPVDSRGGTPQLSLAGIQSLTQTTAQHVDSTQAAAGLDQTGTTMLPGSRVAGRSLRFLALALPAANFGAIFPFIGLVAAVAITQLLRRRRVAQLRAISSIGQ